MELSDAKRMAEADRTAIDARGISSLLLMERAAAFVGREAMRLAGVAEEPPELSAPKHAAPEPAAEQQPALVPEPEAAAEPEPAPDPAPAQEEAPETQPEAEAEPETEPEPAPEETPAPPAEGEPVPESEAEAVKEPEPEAAGLPVQEDIPPAAPVSEAVPEPAPESAPKAAPAKKRGFLRSLFGPPEQPAPKHASPEPVIPEAPAGEEEPVKAEEPSEAEAETEPSEAENPVPEEPQAEEEYQPFPELLEMAAFRAEAIGAEADEVPDPLEAPVVQAQPLDKRAVIFAGPGNNGGDGIGAAVYLKERGFDVRVFLVGNRERMTPDSLEMERRLAAVGGQVELFSADKSAAQAAAEKADVLIDALFGVGLSRPLAGDAMEAVQLINQADRPVVAADIPSGVSANTGVILGDAVRAASTVTFSMAKPGHFVEPGEVYTGRLLVKDIGIPRDVLADAVCGVRAIRREDVALPRRQPLTHKGDYGKLLIVAGCVGYTGAPTLCAKAAMTAGAGLVYLGVPADIYDITAVKNDEAMPFPLSSNGRGRVSEKAISAIRKQLNKSNVCVIGPGLGRDEDTSDVVLWLLHESKWPVIADADAIWAISQDLTVLNRARCPVILTPHEGEFTRLQGLPVNDRLQEARDFAADHHCTVVLKGHRTICAFPDGKAAVITAGNPGMASGGTGDVLAGVLGGLVGQMPLEQAVVTACWLHARAGDLAAEELGEYAVTAGSVLSFLPAAEREIIL